MLNIGIADFNEPTLLLLGDAKSLAWLAHQVEAGTEMDFAKTPGVSLQIKFALHLQTTPQGGGLKREEQSFVWHMTPIQGQRLARKIRGLADSKTPAHAYLDPEPNLADVEVVASMGEYDPATIFQT